MIKPGRATNAPGTAEPVWRSNMPKTIPLSQGLATVVDDEDFEWLSQWKWAAVKSQPSSTIWYARRYVATPARSAVSMHRLILDAPTDVEVDHRNGNGLDNRRSNLRLATHTQNVWNSRTRKDNTSGCKGVSWDEKKRKWRVRIGVGGVRVQLGYFDDPKEASEKYTTAALYHHGEFARDNP